MNANPTSSAALLRLRRVLLVGAAIALEGSFVGILRLGSLKAHVPALLEWSLAASLFYLIGLLTVLRLCPAEAGDSRWERRFVLLAALAFQVTLLPLYPSLSGVAYRYHWDGKIQFYQFNPYQFSPNNSIFSTIRGLHYFQVTNKSVAAVYPPLAERVLRLNYLLFHGIRSEKLLFIGYNLLAIVALTQLLRQRGRPGALALIYAWAPLTVIEIAANGHMESLAILLVLLAFLWAGRHDRLSGAAYSAAVLVNLFAVLLFPVYLRCVKKLRWGWMALITVLSTLPYIWIYKRFGGRYWAANLRLYAQSRFGHNASLFHLWLKFFNGHAHFLRWSYGLSAALVLLSILWTQVRRMPPMRACLFISGTMLLVAANVFPWYVLLVLPFAALELSAGWIYFSAAVLSSYQGLLNHFDQHLLLWEYLPLYALLAFGLFWDWRRRATAVMPAVSASPAATEAPAAANQPAP